MKKCRTAEALPGTVYKLAAELSTTPTDIPAFLNELAIINYQRQ
jgi:hypothetical protein